MKPFPMDDKELPLPLTQVLPQVGKFLPRLV